MTGKSEPRGSGLSGPPRTAGSAAGTLPRELDAAGEALSRRDTSRAGPIAARALALLPAAPALVHAMPTRPGAAAEEPSAALVLVLCVTLATLCGAPFQGIRRDRLRPLAALLGGAVAAATSFGLLASLGAAALACGLGALFAYGGTTLGSGAGLGRARFGRYGVRRDDLAGAGFRGRHAAGRF
ncbi:MAG: hypothetical protein JSU66_17470 [Deltaproteobacteria bacterium]|nr:MAG: hypothetical protein JSU66_17470 [Deltaproteobacteria bacterium]